MSSKFTLDQVAHRLRVTQRTVHRWIEEGQVQPDETGRIAEQVLEDFLRDKGPGWFASEHVTDRFSDQEMDAEISQAILGYEARLTSEGWRQQIPGGEMRELPFYSIDQAAADLLADEVMQRRGWRISMSPPGGLEPDLWSALLFIGDEHVCGAGAPTYELAVCRVALKQHYLLVADQLRASMRPMTVPSEVLIREDRDQR